MGIASSPSGTDGLSRVLVTGATGFVGRALVRRLERESSEICAIGRSATLPVDLTDFESLLEVVRAFRPSAVFHLAATGASGSTPPAESYALNVEGTRNLTRSLSSLSEPPLLVVAGSLAEYGATPGPYLMDSRCDPTSLYGATKHIATEIVRHYVLESGASGIVLRACDLYGPGREGAYFLPSLIRTLRSGEPFAMSAGEQIRDYLFVHDFVDALVRCRSLTDGGFRAIPLGSGDPQPLRIVATMTAQLLDSEHLLQIGAFPYRNDEQMNMYADVTPAREQLGWRAQHSLLQGLSATLEP